MRGLNERRRLSPHRFRAPGLRTALAVGSAVALGSLGPPAHRPGAGVDAVPRASAQAQHVPRALDITPLGIVGGPMTAVAVDGRNVYAVRGTSLEAFDGTDPVALRPIGSARLPGSVTVTGRGAVLAAGGGQIFVQRLDARENPPAPVWHVFRAQPERAPLLIAEVPGAGVVTQAAVRDGHLFTIDATGLRIFDLRRPEHMEVVTAMDGARTMLVEGPRLFVATWHIVDGSVVTEVQAFDVSDPSLPVLLAEQTIEGRVRAMNVYHSQLIVWREQGANSPADIDVVVLSADPPSLAQLAVVRVGTWFRLVSVNVVGDNAVVHRSFANGDWGVSLAFYDLRGLPVMLPMNADCGCSVSDDAQVTALGDVVLVADGGRGLATHVGRVRGRVETLGSPSGLATDGTYVYTLDDDGEVWVLRATQAGRLDIVAHAPLDPVNVGSTESATVALDRGRLYIAHGGSRSSIGSDGKVFVVDVTDPLRPRTVTHWWAYFDDYHFQRRPKFGFGVTTFGPAAVDGRIIVNGRPGPIELVPDPDDPPKLHAGRVYDPDCRPGDGPPTHVETCLGRGLAVDGRDLFVARAGEVQRFDIAPDGPLDPVERIRTGGEPHDLALTDRAIFVANGAAGLHVVDRRSDRTADLGGVFGGYRVALAENTAFVVGPAMPGAPWNAWPSVWAVDVTDPFRPALRGHATLVADGSPASGESEPPHILRLGDLLLATVPNRGIAVYRLADGRPLPASRIVLPSVIVAR